MSCTLELHWAIRMWSFPSLESQWSLPPKHQLCPDTTAVRGQCKGYQNFLSIPMISCAYKTYAKHNVMHWAFKELNYRARNKGRRSRGADAHQPQGAPVANAAPPDSLDGLSSPNYYPMFYTP